MYRLKNILVATLLSVFAVSANAQQSDNVVTATYGNATGNTTRTMTVALNHTKDYVAFHLVMDLPAGTTVDAVTAKSPLINGKTIDLLGKGGSAEESTDFKVPFNQNGTKCNIVGYNYGNEKIGGNSGDVLLTVTLTTTEGAAFDGVTTACTFVDASSKEVALGSPVTVARLWGDVNKDSKLNATDVNAAINAASTGNSDGLDHFATNTGIEGVFKATDVSSVINYVK